MDASVSHTKASGAGASDVTPAAGVRVGRGVLTGSGVVSAVGCRVGCEVSTGRRVDRGVRDGRVVVLHLAFHLVNLRRLVRDGDAKQRADAAHETFELLAPLANRLGIWQVKWEMEDLAFRARDPDGYKKIASQLDEKRADRERFIADVTALLRRELAGAGLRADVSGRPKHIYSIWKKMQRKDLGFQDLFDVRGVRILVDDVKDCYAALGLVHHLWVPIPREFDDYIARPKANNYRSLHTAVIGPEEKVLEVQIRTHEMHQANELGVAAHWRYKEGGHRADSGYGRHIAWLRQVLDWRLGSADSEELAQEFRAELLQDSVYVITPQGQVIALPSGSTPVDFAYYVHSGLGHRCRGAKVNGQIVPLTHRLANGDRVEIIATAEGGPSMDWLNPARGFLASGRARAKVRQWFNNQNLETAIAQGRQVVEKILQREGATALALDRLAAKLGHAKVEDLLAEVGRGELTNRSIANAVHDLRAPPAVETVSEEVVLPTIAKSPAGAPGSILVVGVDRLLTGVARCCKPAPPDPIAGFVTRGKGITIHRASCVNLARIRAREPERLIDLPDNTVICKGSDGRPILKPPETHFVDPAVAPEVRDILKNPLLYQEGWGIDAINRQHTYPAA